MVFSSLVYMFLYFPLVIAIYHLIPQKYLKIRNLVLFLFSLVFYAWGEPRYVILMLFTITVGWLSGILIDRAQKKGNIRQARLFMILSIVINLLILAFFKYANFFIGVFNDISGLSVSLLEVSLPIGISFYTFQTLSYSIDVYRKDADLQKNYIDFGAYIAMFPQLIAGPIVRYKTIAKQLNYRETHFDSFSDGVKIFTIGLAKKVLCANTIGKVWTTVSSLPQDEMSVVTSWLGIIAFALQIYFDFSGYSDMAIGLGKMFGFNFEINFNYPYIASSVSDFWRRWHISLSTWFKEYLYIPLGGNRVSTVKYIRNVLIVWLCTGFWHGASWNFIFWGLYFGLFLLFERFFFGKILNKIPKVFGHIYLLFVVLMGWVFFAIDDIQGVMTYFSNLFAISGIPFINDRGIYLLYTNIILFVALFILATPLFRKICDKLKEKNQLALNIIALVGCVVIWIVSTSFLVADTYNPFLYFRF